MSTRKDPSRAQRRLITQAECAAVSKLIDEGLDKLQIRRELGLSPCRLIYIERRIGKTAPRADISGPNWRRMRSHRRMQQLLPVLSAREFGALFGLTTNQAKALRAKAKSRAA